MLPYHVYVHVISPIVTPTASPSAGHLQQSWDIMGSLGRAQAAPSELLPLQLWSCNTWLPGSSAHLRPCHDANSELLGVSLSMNMNGLMTDHHDPNMGILPK